MLLLSETSLASLGILSLLHQLFVSLTLKLQLFLPILSLAMLAGLHPVSVLQNLRLEHFALLLHVYCCHCSNSIGPVGLLLDLRFRLVRHHLEDLRPLLGLDYNPFNSSSADACSRRGTGTSPIAISIPLVGGRRLVDFLPTRES